MFRSAGCRRGPGARRPPSLRDRGNRRDGGMPSPRRRRRERRPHRLSAGNWSAPKPRQAGRRRTSTGTSHRNSWNGGECGRLSPRRARQARRPGPRRPHRSRPSSRRARPRSGIMETRWPSGGSHHRRAAITEHKKGRDAAPHADPNAPGRKTVHTAPDD